MRNTEPEIFLIQRPSLNWNEIRRYLKEVGGESWADKREPGMETEDDIEHFRSMNGGQNLLEFAGRYCYRSWEPGLNANVTKVRNEQSEYLEHVVKVKHTSVLEHANYTFIFHNVSRVFTHELVRHRVGVAISQESLRFVRLTDIPFWTPDWAKEDEELMIKNREVLSVLEEHQQWLAEHFALDDDGVPFAEKKHKTSFMRRLAPIGLSTGLVWTANLNILRHVIQMRTNPGAEEEIRLVFDKVAQLISHEAPDVFSDMDRTVDESGIGVWEVR